MPQVNVLVEGKKVDFYWPKERLIVEADSYGYHGDPTASSRTTSRPWTWKWPATECTAPPTRCSRPTRSLPRSRPRSLAT